MFENVDSDECDDVLTALPDIKGIRDVNHDAVINVQDNIKIFLPPDGGYGWMIVFISFLLLALSEGFMYSFGTLYEDLQDFYDLETTTNIMLIGFIMIAMVCFLGPFLASLCNKFGFRMIVVISSPFAFISILCSAFIKSSAGGIIFLGLFLGTFLCGFVLASCTMLSLWFDEKAPIACAIVFSGTGAGCVIFPFIIDALVMEYTVKGALLVISAIFLNGIPLGLLIRDPMNIVKKSIEITDANTKMLHDSKLLITSGESQFVFSKNSIVQSNFFNSHTSNARQNMNNTHGSTENVQSSCVVIVPNSTERDAEIPEYELPCIETAAYIATINKVLETEHNAIIGPINESNFITSIMTITSQPDQTDYNKITKAISKEIARPFIRNDLFVSNVNLHNLHRRNSNESSHKDTCEANIIITEKDVKSPALAVLDRIFNFELFKSVSFILIILATFLNTPVACSLSQSMKNYAIYINMSRFHYSLFILFNGLFGIIIQAGLGYMTVVIRKWELFYFLNSIVLAICTAIIGYIARFEYVITYGAILAVCNGVTRNLRSLLITRYIPVDRITSTFGYIFLVSGFGMVIAPFLAIIGSKYQQHNLAFIIYGLITIVAGILKIIMLLLKKTN